MLKTLLSLLAFTLVLVLANQSLANEEAHKAPLFPQPTAERSRVVRPATPDLLEPAFMSKVSGGSTTLKWNAVAGADYYSVQVATDPNFKWLVGSDVMAKTNSFEAKGLEAGKHYYWRVFAGKSDNDPGYTKSMPAKSMFEVQ